MNWYTLSKKKTKKKKNKKKKGIDWSQRSKKVMEPYVFNEELGLMYQTPNGMAWADLVKAIEKIGQEKENLSVEARKLIHSGILSGLNDKVINRIKKMLQIGIPATFIAAILYAPFGINNYINHRNKILTDEASKEWYGIIEEASQQSSDVLSGELSDAIKRMIRKHEGTNLENGMHMPYEDSEGHLTVGYGYNLDKDNISEVIRDVEEIGADYEALTSKIPDDRVGLTESQANALFEKSYEEAVRVAKKTFSDFDKLPVHVQAIIIDMSYNLGYKGILSFKKFRDSLDVGGELPFDLHRASLEMKDSKWWYQVGRRSKTLYKIMLLCIENGDEGLSPEQASILSAGYDQYLAAIEKNPEF
jgi:GH24 family phage-related lysozyme (muramidase)